MAYTIWAAYTFSITSTMYSRMISAVGRITTLSVSSCLIWLREILSMLIRYHFVFKVHSHPHNVAFSLMSGRMRGSSVLLRNMFQSVIHAIANKVTCFSYRQTFDFERSTLNVWLWTLEAMNATQSSPSDGRRRGRCESAGTVLRK